jgi:hypothetical protein
MPYLVQAQIDDHTLAVTTETAKEAFAKAVEWHVTGRFSHVSITDDIKTYSLDAFSFGNGASGDCEDDRGHCRAEGGRQMMPAGCG